MRFPTYTSRGAAYQRTLFFFGLGGMLGTWLRAWLAIELTQHPWPWGTLAANLLAAMLIGLILEAGEKLHAHVRAFHAVGFCGGLSTFSAFAVETVKLARAGQAGLAATYVVVSVVGSIFAVYAGFRMAGLWSSRRGPITS
jgi:fluoride exporter